MYFCFVNITSAGIIILFILFFLMFAINIQLFDSTTRVDDDIFLYGVFDGHCGSSASSFAALKMPAELLLGQVSRDLTDQAVKDVLCQVHHLVVSAVTFALHTQILTKNYHLYWFYKSPLALLFFRGLFYTFKPLFLFNLHLNLVFKSYKFDPYNLHNFYIQFICRFTYLLLWTCSHLRLCFLNTSLFSCSGECI